MGKRRSLTNRPPNPVEAARDAVCNRVAANIYGRVAVFLEHAERGEDWHARAELLALLKFFPRTP